MSAMPRPEGSFGAGLCSKMKRNGIRGRPATVKLERAAIRIDGGHSGSMHLPLDGMKRVRIGFYEGSYGKSYRTCLWLSGDPKPLILQPMKPYRDYAAVIRDVAKEVAGRRGIGAVERGIEPGLAMFNFAVLAAASAALALIPWLAWEPALWPLFLLSIVFAALAIYAWREMRRKHLPQPVVDFDELEVQLPPDGVQG